MAIVTSEPSGERPGDGGPLETATLVAETARDLARVARRHDLTMLGFLLDMVILEADDEVKRRVG
jgi:hypothetical protein